MDLGKIRIKEFLEKTKGEIRGKIFTDGKDRFYAADYLWEEKDGDKIVIKRLDGTGHEILIPQTVKLDESLTAFFGLYSGDGSKGTDDPRINGKIKPSISFSQREPNLVRFAVDQFRKLFPGEVNFNFAIGEDSAFFMDGPGLEMLKSYYGGKLPENKDLYEIIDSLSAADEKYLSETRPTGHDNEKCLAFYYQHSEAMKNILAEIKKEALESVGVELTERDKVFGSVRRPFKKGARDLGGSSRSDEIYVGGINGFGEFFLKILHEIEDSIYYDTKISSQGLILWKEDELIGEKLNLEEFFLENPYGQINCKRPSLEHSGLYLEGKWPRSKVIKIKTSLQLDPLWCYVSGLYLAEGSTPKAKLFEMFGTSPGSLSISFTSTENQSIELVLRALQNLFRKEDCLMTWKVKVGSQYFPELVVIGLKHGVPMLRGGNSGDGKMRTMEISLSIKDWALELAPCLREYSDKYSHVEPTGAGIARIDFSASSTLARWYFPLIMYTVFNKYIENPVEGFYS